ncbi:hypothetical protein FVE85_7318 [Porphyridium purpureum]|uniref:Uncharacterized protein n=1 Tax=Porphyridium purpureum TaxID=35688 RepID=A0A5J4ZAF4_PORPP|nr:hypothetical protein FVE85_7318 [Porphyridium purpureum]|eukprot:POR5487..scf295_1
MRGAARAVEETEVDARSGQHKTHLEERDIGVQGSDRDGDGPRWGDDAVVFRRPVRPSGVAGNSGTGGKTTILDESAGLSSARRWKTGRSVLGPEPSALQKGEEKVAPAVGDRTECEPGEIEEAKPNGSSSAGRPSMRSELPKKRLFRPMSTKRKPDRSDMPTRKKGRHGHER